MLTHTTWPPAEVAIFAKCSTRSSYAGGNSGVPISVSMSPLEVRRCWLSFSPTITTVMSGR